MSVGHTMQGGYITDRLALAAKAQRKGYTVPIYPAGRAYVGGSGNIKARWSQHRSKLWQGKHCNRLLQAGWSSLGEESFDFIVLEVVGPSEDLLAAEQRWMVSLSAYGHGFNLYPKAGSPAGLAPTPETRAKISAAHRGKVVGQETRDKLSAANSGKAFTPIRCANISKGILRVRDKVVAAKTGERNPAAKLTAEDVVEVRRRHSTGEPTQSIAERFGVSTASISNVARRLTWKHVP